MLYFRYCLSGLLSLILVACSNSELSNTKPLPETTKATAIEVDIAVGLSADETQELDPRSQNGFDSYTSSEPPESTYHYKTSLTIYDGEHSSYQLEVYFILTSATARSWEIRARLNDVTLTTVDGDGPKLIFDNQGELDVAASTNNGIVNYLANDLSVEQLHLNFTFGSHEKAAVYTLDSIWFSLQGKGFFVTTPSVESDDRFFSRVGDFRLRADGFIVNRYDEYLLAFPVNPDGSVTATSLVSVHALQLPPNSREGSFSSEIEIAVNLPATATPLDPLFFDPDSPLSFTASVSLSIFDSLGNSHIATFYYLKLESPPASANSWAQYLFINAAAIDIAGGITGASGQLYGQINFAMSGNFVNTAPAAMISEALAFTNGAVTTQTLTINYVATSTTQLASGFSISTLGHNGRSALSAVDISDTGIVRGIFAGNSPVTVGKIALVDIINPQDLEAIEATSSLLATISTGYPMPGEATSAPFGSIQAGSLKTPNPVYSEFPYTISINGEGYFITADALDSQQLYVSKQSSFRTDKDGFVINQAGEYLRVFYADDGVITPVIDSIEMSEPMQNTRIRGAARLTSQINIDVNFPAMANAVDVLQFDATDPLTFTSGTALSFIDMLGASHIIRFYFLKDNSGVNQWAVYTFIDQQAVDITGGIDGAAGQQYALLNFDAEGVFQSLLPMPLNLIASFNNGADPQTIQLIFENSTELAATFSVRGLDHNGYKTSLLLSINIDENGIITNHWNDGNSSIYGWVPLQTIADTTCLLPVSDSESFIVDATCSSTTGRSGDTGFGTIEFSFDEIK